MAKKQNKQSAQQGKRPRQAANQPRSPRQPGSGAAQQKKRAAAPQQTAKPKRTNREAAVEAATPGNMLWRLGLILCVGLVIFSLLFASINGGSKYVGITYEKETENVTPTPPVSSVDPNVNITGSDATPIPPSATPETTDTPAPEGGENTGGMYINGQQVTP